MHSKEFKKSKADFLLTNAGRNLDLDSYIQGLHGTTDILFNKNNRYLTETKNFYKDHSPEAIKQQLSLGNKKLLQFQNPHYKYSGNINDSKIQNFIAEEMPRKIGPKTEKQALRVVKKKAKLEAKKEFKKLERNEGFIGPHRPIFKKNKNKNINRKEQYMVSSGIMVGGIAINKTKNDLKWPSQGTKFEKLLDVIIPNDQAFHTILSLILNPGNITLAPIGSTVGSLFELGLFEVLKFHWKPQVSEVSATSGVGSAVVGRLGMGVEYNPFSPNFLNMTFLEQHANSISGPIFSPMSMDVLANGALSKNPVKNLYVQYNANQVGLDPPTMSFGTFNLCVQGIPAQYCSTVAGELWVEYRMKFSQVKEYSASGGNCYIYATGGTTSAVPLTGRIDSNVNAWQTNPINIVGNTGNYLSDWNMPFAGDYMIFIYAYSSTSTFTAANALFFGANISATNYWRGGAISQTGAAGSPATGSISIHKITVSLSGTTSANNINLTGATPVTTNYGAINIVITPCTPGLLPNMIVTKEKELVKSYINDKFIELKEYFEKNRIIIPESDDDSDFKENKLTTSPSFVGKLEGLLSSISDKKMVK